MASEVRIGMLGSGFIGEFHALGLRYVPGVRVAANWGAGPERREAFAARFGSRPLDSIDAVCADPDVDLVVVSLPNHLHVEAVRSAAAHGKAVACTKPLGRNAAEAGEMVRLVETAGAFSVQSVATVDADNGGEVNFNPNQAAFSNDPGPIPQPQ